MQKIIVRFKTYEEKLHDSDFSKTIRELDTSKKINDIFSEFSDYDEDTTFNIFEKGNETPLFTITVHNFKVLENAVKENAVEKLSSEEMQNLAKLYVLGMQYCNVGYSIEENLIELKEKLEIKVEENGKTKIKKMPQVILQNRIVNIVK